MRLRAGGIEISKQFGFVPPKPAGTHHFSCRLRDRPAPPQRIEEAFGWIKSAAGLAVVELRGLDRVAAVHAGLAT
jgi:hypothetical protein